MIENDHERMKAKFYDVEQNTEEWQQLRCGRLTSSNLSKVMANYGKAFGEPAKRLAVSIAVQQITGEIEESSYKNEHMERGHEQEPIARQLYESVTYQNVANGGFFGSDFVGCSPDGLLEDDGLIEIKSVIASTHYATLKRARIDPAYRWQCIGNLKLTGRNYLDFISYCSTFPPISQLYIVRMDVDSYQNEFEMLDMRIEQFEHFVNQIKCEIG